MKNPVPALKPSMMALSLALAMAAPRVHAATFEGGISRDGDLVIQHAPDAAVFAYETTAYQRDSFYEGDVANGFSRVSAISDGTLGKTITSTLVFRQAVTNPLGQSQAVSFGFVVPSATTTIDLGNGSNIQSFSALASFTGTISWGGAVLWSMDYGVGGSGSVTAGSGSFYATGSGLVSPSGNVAVGAVGGTAPFLNHVGLPGEVGLAGVGTIVSPNYHGNLSLGSLAAFESKDLVYTLTASASYEATYRDPSAQSVLGYGGFAQPGVGDPFGIDFTPNAAGDGVSLPGFVSAVPEPSGVALMVAGLVVLAWRGQTQRPWQRRREKTRQLRRLNRLAQQAV